MTAPFGSGWARGHQENVGGADAGGPPGLSRKGLHWRAPERYIPRTQCTARATAASTLLQPERGAE